MSIMGAAKGSLEAILILPESHFGLAKITTKKLTNELLIINK